MQQLHSVPSTDVTEIAPIERSIANQRGTCSIRIASVNVKNVGTNLNFVKYLAKSASMLFLQELSENTLAKIYYDAEFAAGCVDDFDPVGLSLHARGHGDTCIVRDAAFNSKMKALLETNGSLNVVQLKQDVFMCILSGLCVHASTWLLEECLDMLHEIIVKYN